MNRPGNHPDIHMHKQVEPRPLTRLLQPQMQEFMVGYEKQRKKLHYYKCHHCQGVSPNAMTTLESQKKRSQWNCLWSSWTNSRLSGFVPLIMATGNMDINHFNAGLSKGQGFRTTSLRRWSRSASNCKSAGLGKLIWNIWNDERNNLTGTTTASQQRNDVTPQKV